MSKLKINKEPIRLITTCDKLMMDKFIDCLVSENYNSLIISGNPSKEQLDAAWNNIISEYAELIGSEHYETIIRLTKEINAAVFKFNRVSLYVFILGIMHSESIANHLRKMGYPGNYNPSNQEMYKRDLETSLNKAKTLLAQAQQKQIQLNKLESSIEKGKIDRRHFDEVIIALSDHKKYQVKEDQITVQKYCIMIKNMKRRIEILNKKEYGRATH